MLSPDHPPIRTQGIDPIHRSGSVAPLCRRTRPTYCTVLYCGACPLGCLGCLMIPYSCLAAHFPSSLFLFLAFPSSFLLSLSSLLSLFLLFCAFLLSSSLSFIPFAPVYNPRDSSLPGPLVPVLFPHLGYCSQSSLSAAFFVCQVSFYIIPTACLSHRKAFFGRVCRLLIHERVRKRREKRKKKKRVYRLVGLTEFGNSAITKE